jgi:hypothetical protein
MYCRPEPQSRKVDMLSDPQERFRELKAEGKAMKPLFR